MPLKVMRKSVEERQADEEDPEAQELLGEASAHDVQADLTAGRSKYSDRGPAYEATTWSGPVMFLHLAAGTAIWTYLLPPGSNLGDAFYFAVVTFFTIGYGDITPASTWAKTFFIFYVAASFVVQLTVLSSFVHAAISFKEGGGVVPEDMQGRVVVIYKMKPRILAVCKGVAIMVVVITLGALSLHVSEGKSWIDSTYWAVASLSTVGYGDITPHKFKVWYGAYFLVGCVVFTYVLGEIVGIIVEMLRWRRLMHVFDGGLSQSLIERMDYFHDGQVSKVEWMMFLLKELSLVDESELKNILSMFEAIDTNGDGVLSMDDVRQTYTSESAVSPTRSNVSGPSTRRRGSSFQGQRRGNGAEAPR